MERIRALALETSEEKGTGLMSMPAPFVKGCFQDWHYLVCEEEKDNIDSVFSQITGSIQRFRFLKDDRGCLVFLYPHGAQNWVVKRYRIKSWRHGLSRCFRKTRARIFLKAAQCLQEAHIKAAKPIAILEKAWGSLRREAYVIMEDLPGYALSDYILKVQQDPLKRQRMIQKAIQVLQALKSHCLRHGDLKADNFRVVAGDLYLIDLDCLVDYRKVIFFKGLRFRRAFRSDLRRFLRNWEKDPDLHLFCRSLFYQEGLS